jgi:hypothetical protein
MDKTTITLYFTTAGGHESSAAVLVSNMKQFVSFLEGLHATNIRSIK